MSMCNATMQTYAHLFSVPEDARLMLERRFTLPAPAEAATADAGRPLIEVRPTDEEAAEAVAGRAAEATGAAAEAAAGTPPPRALLTASLAAFLWAPSSPEIAAVSSPGANRAARASARREAEPRTSAALSVDPMARACHLQNISGQRRTDDELDTG